MMQDTDDVDAAGPYQVEDHMGALGIAVAARLDLRARSSKEWILGEPSEAAVEATHIDDPLFRPPSLLGVGGDCRQVSLRPRCDAEGWSPPGQSRPPGLVGFGHDGVD